MLLIQLLRTWIATGSVTPTASWLRALSDPNTDDPIEMIGRSVGYTSEYAFSRAFARAHPPGRYRIRSRQGVHTAGGTENPSHSS